MQNLISPRQRTRPLATGLTTSASPSALEAGSLHPDIKVLYRDPSELKAAAKPLRRRGKGQVASLAANLARFGCLVPLVISPEDEIIDGHAVLEAAKSLGLTRVPTVCVSHLNEAEIRALRLSLGRISELSEWDPLALKAEFEHLFEVDPSLVNFTGFDMPRIDMILGASDLGADVAEPEPTAPPKRPVSRLGDLWLFAGGHGAYCGNARDPASYLAALRGQTAQMVLSDIPYGVSIKGVVSRTHGEFVDGSSMNETQALDLFQSFLAAMLPQVQDGAIVDLFIDHRGMYGLTTAIRAAGLAHLCTCTWVKSVAGMGGLYRHQCEFVMVTKWGKAPAINNIQLGKHGRNRSTAWEAPGFAGFTAGRKAALEQHATQKPTGLLVEALLDTSLPGGVILDPFLGSGSLLLAAHRTRRVGIGIELDPAFVDVTVRRMETFTGQPARHAETGLTFAETAVQRQTDPPPRTRVRPAAAAQA